MLTITSSFKRFRKSWVNQKNLSECIKCLQNYKSMSTCVYAIEFNDKTWKVGGSNNTIQRLNSYKGPSAPIFCVLQFVMEYRGRESELLEKMKASSEWELKAGNEYFTPQISSEDAKKWIRNHFQWINKLESIYRSIFPGKRRGFVAFKNGMYQRTGSCLCEA